MARPLLTLAVRRVLTALEVGGVALRSLGAAPIGARATLTAACTKAAAVAAPLRAVAVLAAAVRLRRDSALQLRARAQLSASAAKLTRSSTAPSARAVLAATVAKAAAEAAATAAQARLSVRAEFAGDTLCDAGGDGFIFSDGDSAAYVTRTT